MRLCAASESLECRNLNNRYLAYHGGTPVEHEFHHFVRKNTACYYSSPKLDDRCIHSSSSPPHLFGGVRRNGNTLNGRRDTHLFTYITFGFYIATVDVLNGLLRFSLRRNAVYELLYE